MIITNELLNQKVPKEMLPTRLDSALNLYTNVHHNNDKGIIVYNTNPDTWNCLYPFYELNHKFTIDNYDFKVKNPTYKELIEEYKVVYQKLYEQEKGFTKEIRISALVEEYKRTFNLKSVNISDELEPIFELKYSKSKNVWTLYYFENYVAKSIDKLSDLINQKLYDQRILPLDSSITCIDGIDITSNVPYLLSINTNIKKLNDNLIEYEKE